MVLFNCCRKEQNSSVKFEMWSKGQFNKVNAMLLAMHTPRTRVHLQVNMHFKIKTIISKILGKIELKQLK